MTQKNPRILVISHRRLRPTVCRGSQNEFEDVIAEVDAAEIVAPPMNVVEIPSLLSKVQRKLHGLVGLDIRLADRPRVTPITGNYDLVFVILQSLSDLDILDAVPGWRTRSAKAVIWVEELWISSLIYSQMLEPLKQFDQVFTNCSQTCAPLQEKIGVPCLWEAAGVDMFRFCPYPHLPARVIDFQSMGRRSKKTHEALLAMAEKGNFFYLYDTATFRQVLDHRQHREMLANCAKRARYFLANKAKVERPEDRGAQEEVGVRFFEGAAAGTVMVGDPPCCAGFDTYFDWPDAVISLPFDSVGVADLLADLDAQPDRLERIRRDNVVNCLHRHDWVHRWARVLRLMGLEATPAMALRLERLNELAEKALHR